MTTIWNSALDGSISITDTLGDRRFCIRETASGFVIETHQHNSLIATEPARCKPHAMLTVMDMIRETGSALRKAA